MRKRNIDIKFRLTEQELEELDNKVALSGLNREAYIRKVLAGAELKEVPSLEYHQFKRELSRIGNNLNQIARIANISQRINKEAYFENAEKLRDFYEWLIKRFE
ncbi:MAG: plasmid mobilization protein [Saccharofermentanales bacterium]|jgi:hypothetical protein